MKKWNKSLLAVLVVATVGGGLTPVWASEIGLTDTKTDVVETKTDGTETKADTTAAADTQVTTQTTADTTTVTTQQGATEETKVAVGEENVGILSVAAETVGDVTTIKGTVSANVTKLVLTKPTGDRLEIVSLSNGTFTVNIPAVNDTTAKYALVEAYAGEQRIDSEYVLLNTVKDVVTSDVIFFAKGFLDPSREKVQVRAAVVQTADQVFVTYGDKRQEVKLRKLWDGVSTIKAVFDVNGNANAEAVIEAYKNGVLVEKETVKLETIAKPKREKAEIEIEGKALLVPNQKTIKLAGELEVEGIKADNLKVYVVAPDGQKHLLQIKEEGKFEVVLPYHDRRNDAKYLWFMVYDGDQFIGKGKMSYSIAKAIKKAEKAAKQEQKKTEKHAKVKVDVTLKVEGVKGKWDDDDHDDDHDDHKDRDHHEKKHKKDKKHGKHEGRDKD